MRVVADTGPLNYLILIREIDILPALFRVIVVPEEVAAELGHPDAPPAVRTRIQEPLSWLRVETCPGQDVPHLARLDIGERAAALLACATGADLLLMDDRAGVPAARASGLSVTGTLGLLDLAARRGLVDLELALQKLRATSFRCRPALLDAVLERHRSETGEGAP